MATTLFNFHAEAPDGSGHFRRGTIAVTDDDVARVGASSHEEAARLILEERERDWAAFRLDATRAAELLNTYTAEGAEPLPAEALPGERAEHLRTLHERIEAELPSAAPRDDTEEEKDEFRRLSVSHRAWLNLHRQEQPYKLASLEPREPHAWVVG